MTYSGFWKRFLALLIDGIIVWIICLVLIVPYFIPPLTFIIAAYYYVVFYTSPLRATPGKALMKISVVKTNGNALTIKDALIRYAVSFLSGAFFCVGYIISLFTEKKQTFHDIIADTIVIDETFAENNFWQIFVSQTKIIFNMIDNKTSDFKAERPINTQSLEELYNLYQKGILTEEEYKKKKEEYLTRL